MKSPFTVFSVATALLLLVGGLDYITGPELGFFVFYFLPISIPAWYLGGRMAALFSLAAIFVWFVVEGLNGRVYSSELIRYWNGGIRLVAFLIIGFTLSRIKVVLEREKELNEELSRALGEVKRLSGLLPICANCKKIRDDQGYWHQVESYVREHSEAEFSHSICPACLEKLYPQLRGKTRSA